MSVVHGAPAGSHPELGSGDLHIWRGSLDAPAPQLLRLRSFVSREEEERAACFYLQRDRDRFVARRGLLRLLLGRYLGRCPEDVELKYGPNGKPELAGSLRAPALRFNVSHSRGTALFAFASSGSVGIDLEALRPVPEAEQIAEHFFSPRERAALKALPPAARLEAFLRCWTCKEAYLKATGEGLSRPLDQVEVELSSHGPAELLTPDSASWTLREIFLGAGYVGTCVVETAGIGPGQGRRLVAGLTECVEIPQAVGQRATRRYHASDASPYLDLDRYAPEYMYDAYSTRDRIGRGVVVNLSLTAFVAPFSTATHLSGNGTLYGFSRVELSGWAVVIAVLALAAWWRAEKLSEMQKYDALATVLALRDLSASPGVNRVPAAPPASNA